jgi:hypothetical protein
VDPLLKSFREAVVPSSTQRTASNPDGGEVMETDDVALVQSDLKEMKHLLISSHRETQQYHQELQRVTKECVIMKHKFEVLLLALEEVSKHSDNSTISSLASLVASIRMIGSDDSPEDPPPKPSVVFTTNKTREFYKDLPVTEISRTRCDGRESATSSPSSLALANANAVDSTATDGAWMSPSRQHTAAAVTPSSQALMDVEPANQYTVLESLGKTHCSGGMSSPDNRKRNKSDQRAQSSLGQVAGRAGRGGGHPGHGGSLLSRGRGTHGHGVGPFGSNGPGQVQDPASTSTYNADGKRVNGPFISQAIDGAAQMMVTVMGKHANAADTTVTRGQQTNSTGSSNNRP